MSSAIWAPGENGPERPSTARVRDYWLGGSHHNAADETLAEQIVVCAPHLPYGVRIHRAFLRRVITWLVGAGVRQFIDLGSGTPTVGNVHETAQTLDPECRVLYTDIDPVVVAEGRDLLADNDNAVYLQADLRRPEQVFDSPELKGLIDLTERTAVLLVDVLHFVRDRDDPDRLVHTYADALCPDSYVAMSHMGADDGILAAMQMFVRMYGGSLPEMTFRGRPRIERFCTGMAIVEPGIVPVPLWRPDDADPDEDRNPDHFHDRAVLARTLASGER
ncbi:MAG TPA: SAM-dependent methyltransferase [Pseudonocardiaceae bacterium]|nr:SAM-dependent methyltransferase [Pseudonocardiaceae bacterium]